MNYKFLIYTVVKRDSSFIDRSRHPLIFFIIIIFVLLKRTEISDISQNMDSWSDL